MEQLAPKNFQWLQKRLISYPRALAVLYVLCILTIIVSASLSPSGLTDLMGYPVGRDFSHYWAASSLALEGTPAEVYNIPEFSRVQEELFQTQPPYAWFYPPTFLLILYPLALLPYLVALVLWLALTLGAFLLVVRRIAPHPRTMWLALAFPGTMVNLVFGQNGFLSGALLGGGLLLLGQYPWVGGFLLGLLSYKPHLVVLIPLALIAGRQWKALVALVMGAAGLAGASYLAFGGTVWSAFFMGSGTTMKLLANPALPTDKMITVLAAAINYGAPLWLAWTLQLSVSLLAAVVVAAVWYRESPFYLRASVLVLGILLATPYGFPYDVVLLALPLAWMGWAGYTQGWLDYEPEFLFGGWLLPIFIMPLNFLGFNFVAPLGFMALMGLALRRLRGAGPIPVRY